jgi:hypothetical protein
VRGVQKGHCKIVRWAKKGARGRRERERRGGGRGRGRGGVEAVRSKGHRFGCCGCCGHVNQSCRARQSAQLRAVRRHAPCAMRHHAPRATAAAAAAGLPAPARLPAPGFLAHPASPAPGWWQSTRRVRSKNPQLNCYSWCWCWCWQVPQPPKPEFSRLNTQSGATHASERPAPARPTAPIAVVGQCIGCVWGGISSKK